jgi:hypothetical protein
MTAHKHYRILMPGGLESLDTFVVAGSQPDTIRAGCLLLVHEPTGRQITVHTTRLVPADADDGPAQRICPECGKVEGVVEDEVICPYHSETPCALLAPAQETYPSRSV